MLMVSWFACVVGLAMCAAWWRLWRDGSVAMLSMAWLGYAVYEYLMNARVLCSGECNIRVDLLLLWPLLMAVTLLVLWRGLRQRRATRKDRG